MVMRLSGSSAATFQKVLLLLILVKSSYATMIVYVDPDPESYVINDKRDDYYIPKFKRSGVVVIKHDDSVEHVCQTKTIKSHTPHFGHLLNGSRVEIQQDEDYNFVATFVECAQNDRPPCHGIDTRRFSSECVTEFENRTARVRLVQAGGAFMMAFVRVPIACQCKLRRIPTIFQR